MCKILFQEEEGRGREEEGGRRSEETARRGAGAAPDQLREDNGQQYF